MCYRIIMGKAYYNNHVLITLINNLLHRMFLYIDNLFSTCKIDPRLRSTMSGIRRLLWLGVVLTHWSGSRIPRPLLQLLLSSFCTFASFFCSGQSNYRPVSKQTQQHQHVPAEYHCQYLGYLRDLSRHQARCELLHQQL